MELNALFGFAGAAQFQETHRQWIEQALTRKLERENRWSEAVAVGSLAFVENVKSELGSKALHRDCWSLSNHQVSQNSIFKG